VFSDEERLTKHLVCNMNRVPLLSVQTCNILYLYIVRSKLKYVQANKSENYKILAFKKTGLDTGTLAAQN